MKNGLPKPLFLLLCAAILVIALFLGNSASAEGGLNIQRFSSALYGGCLAVAGYLLQSLYEIPLAGPGLLGVAQGGRLFALLPVLIGALLKTENSASFPIRLLCAVAGCLAVMGFLCLLSRRRAGMQLLFTGVVTGIFFRMATEIMTARLEGAAGPEAVPGYERQNLGLCLLFLLPALIAAFCLARPLGAYRMGREYAAAMGMHVRAIRVGLAVIAAVLAGTATAAIGPVILIGAAAPVAARALTRSSSPLNMLAASLILGGALGALGDALAGLPVFAGLSSNAVMGFLSAPILLLAMGRGMPQNKIR